MSPVTLRPMPLAELMQFSLKAWEADHPYMFRTPRGSRVKDCDTQSADRATRERWAVTRRQRSPGRSRCHRRE
jgi:hypothetical protein